MLHGSKSLCDLLKVGNLVALLSHEGLVVGPRFTYFNTSLWPPAGAGRETSVLHSVSSYWGSGNSSVEYCRIIFSSCGVMITLLLISTEVS